MNELTKSLTFAIVGSLLVGVATFVYFRSQPKEIDQFAMVGEEFFPNFDSPNDVRALQISAYDFDSRDVKEFRVEYQDDRWVIASHYGYPAEAADRLDRTAASVLGIQREALAGRRANEHKRFGVVDPESEEADSVNRSDQDAVGVRISLQDRNEEPLVDYIIGKEVDRQNEEDPMLREIRGLDPALPLHYVRVPGEPETYVASIQVDVSTKFADWIEPDLLVLDAQALRKLVINDYSYEEKLEEVELVPGSGIMQQVRRLERVEGQEYTLTKPAGFGPWALQGLDPATEELDSAKLSSLTRALDDFKIVGVAPRYKYQGNTILNADLELEFPDSIRSRNAAEQIVQEVARDLGDKGFNLTQNSASGKLAIGADQGELTAATEEGLVYHLYFGNELSGSEREIELGTAATAADVEGDAASEDATAEGQDEAAKNRYVLVRVAFDQAMLGDPPVQPTKPEPPSAAQPTPMNQDQPQPDSNDGNADGAGNGDTTADDAPADPPAQPGTSSGDAGTSSGDNSTSGDNGTTKGDDNNGNGDDNNASSEGAALNDANVVNRTLNGPFSPEDDSVTLVSTRKQDDTKQDDTKQDDTKQAEDTQGDASGSQDGDSAGDNEAAATDQDPMSNQDPMGTGQEEPIDPQVEYQRQLQAFQSEMAMYQSSLQQYERRKALSEEKVRLLNQRFQDWYYVISAENLETLTVSRSDLVKPKTADDANPTGGIPGSGNNFPPSLNPAQLPAGAPPKPPTQNPDNGGEQ